MKVKKVCVVGAGNVGVALAIDISVKTGREVTLLTKKNDLESQEFFKVDSDTGKRYTSNKIRVTSDYKVAIEEADFVFVTLPSFMVESCMKEINRYSPKIIVFVPGYGGKEFFCQKLMSKGCIVAGFDRSPYVARLSGKYEVVASTKKSVRLGCMTRQYTEKLCNLLSDMVDFECLPLDNYLTVALTPSNPILHTARLFSIFKNVTVDTGLSDMIKFYGEWDDVSSEVLLAMDAELQTICKQFKNMDLSGVIPLSIHYESDSVQALTNKIRSIKSWHNLDSPMKKVDGQYFIDLESRYFQEDFSFGLCILKSYAQIVDVATPTMDKVLCWYQKLSGIQFFDSKGKLTTSILGCGSIPQRFGITKVCDVEKFYNGGV